MFRRATQLGRYWPLVLILLLGGGVCFFGGLFWQQHLDVKKHQRRLVKNPLPRMEEEVVPAVTGENGVGHVRGEFQYQAGILLGCNELLEYHPHTLWDIVKAIHEQIGIVGLVLDEKQRMRLEAMLKEHGLPEDTIDCFVWPAKAMWVRDFGPFFLVEKKQATVVGYAYTPPNRDQEDLFGVSLAATFGMPFQRANLSMEGGNLLTNGDGLCVTSSILIGQNAGRGYDVQQIGKVFHDSFHFDRWTYLKPLAGEPTGHVDMMATFCAPNVVVIGRYNTADDVENAEILDENAALLGGAPTKEGPLKVERIPMPSHKDDVWRTYTNVIYANDTLLVPQYPQTDPQLDKVALDTYRRLLPKWKIVGIDCTSLAAKRGDLHCISLSIPLLPKE